MIVRGVLHSHSRRGNRPTMVVRYADIPADWPLRIVSRVPTSGSPRPPGTHFSACGSVIRRIIHDGAALSVLQAHPVGRVPSSSPGQKTVFLRFDRPLSHVLMSGHLLTVRQNHPMFVSRAGKMRPGQSNYTTPNSRCPTNSPGRTPPGHANSPPPVCVTYWFSMSNFAIFSNDLMNPVRGSAW